MTQPSAPIEAAAGEPAGHRSDDAAPSGRRRNDADPAPSGEEPDEADAVDTPEPEPQLPDGLPVRQVIEAILFATDGPLSAGKIAQILEQGTGRHVRRCIAQLNEQYERQGRAFRIEEVAGGFQMLTLPDMQPWLAKLLRSRQENRLSPTQMETLAVIAYKQPALRADVEVVRGVACGDVINRLREMGLVKIVGRAEDVGRPLLYGTTRKFLRVFGLGSLEDLPRVEELRPPPSGPREAQGDRPAPESQPAGPPAGVEEPRQASPSGADEATDERKQ